MRRLLAREDGIAMPTALMVLTLCLVLTAVVARGADQLSASSGEDQRAKRALAAADAGVSVAIRRLRSLPDLKDEHCLTDTPAGVLPNASGECDPTPFESLGGGASFSYVVTPARKTPGGCYEVPGTVVPAGYLRRCITSTGRVGDVVRRVQTQVVTPPRAGGQWIGILGLDRVEIINSAKLSACHSDEIPGPTIGSNLSIEIENSAILNHACADKSWGVSMPDGRTPTIHWGAQPNPIRQTTAPAPYTIPAPPRTFDEVRDDNDLADALATATSSNVVSNANVNQRSIRINNSGSLRFTRGGDFSICSLYVDNSGNLEFSATEKTRLWIDSPTRPGSNCPGGATGLNPQNGSRINWPASVSDTDYATLTARAKNLEIYVYDQYVTFRNSMRFAGLIQNERNTVHYVNSSLTWGAVAAKTVILENSGNFQRPVGLLSWGPDGPPYRAAGWSHCRDVPPVASDPESGCS